MNIKLLVMDVDGTLTDGKIYIGAEGEVFKAFNVKDGYGIHDLLIPAGITPVIITGRKSGIVEARCRELGIERCYQGVRDKVQQLDQLLQEMGQTYAQVAYIGDDLNDLPCIEKVRSNGGIVACPRDAVESVRNVAHFISIHDGGNGAVRDFIDTLIRKE